MLTDFYIVIADMMRGLLHAILCNQARRYHPSYTSPHFTDHSPSSPFHVQSQVIGHQTDSNPLQPDGWCGTDKGDGKSHYCNEGAKEWVIEYKQASFLRNPEKTT